ncbi:MAG: LLM class flavin-dependent oxidoreductase [Anaerolineaceae bacterium]|jgi:5,10-methylenetetrahydromethanopterin reductase|nr:LLM class flavin-dependent oxidoreductase [Anaerolineaceae bacterium]
MKLGINIIPVMPISEIIAIMQAAESIGYEYCLLADEGMTPDVWVTLGLAARETEKIFLGPVTNGYTRHPAVTAIATATLNQISDGRAVLVMVAGGSIVMDTFMIQREKPLAVMQESIEICRKLWSGASINFAGEMYSLNNAHMEVPPQNIPIWIAARGKKMLQLAGRFADGVLLMMKSDIGPAVELISQYENGPLRIYMDRIAYTEQMIEDATHLFPYVLKDTPERQLTGFLNEEEIIQLKQALETGGTAAVAKLITPDMIKRYKIAGSPQECRQTIHQLKEDHHLDMFVLNITSAGLEKNLQMLTDIYSIVNE